MLVYRSRLAIALVALCGAGALTLATRISAGATGNAGYAFGGGSQIRGAAEPFQRGACYACHERHAAHDKVFLQFYPLLAAAAPAGWAPANRP